MSARVPYNASLRPIRICQKSRPDPLCFSPIHKGPAQLLGLTRNTAYQAEPTDCGQRSYQKLPLGAKARRSLQTKLRVCWLIATKRNRQAVTSYGQRVDLMMEW